MRAKLDENLPAEAADLLRAAGWRCDTVHDEGLAGADDGRVAAACRAEERVLFTMDLDFADIRSYPPSEHEGIVVLRPATRSRRDVLALLASSRVRAQSLRPNACISWRDCGPGSIGAFPGLHYWARLRT